MKLKNLFILLALTMMGCKDTLKNQENDGQNGAASEKVFKVLLNVVVKNNDDFCLLYTEDGTLNFNQGVWKGLKGSENEQIVEFDLPNNVFPTQLRLDLGKSLEQGDILLKSVKFEYSGKSKMLNGPEIGAFFRPDPSKCTFDSNTGIVKALVKDGKKEIPSLYPNESVLSIELPLLAK